MKLLYLLFIIPLVSGDRIVTTNSGPIRGTTVATKKVEAFLGIPYAEPPVGPLRFSKPVPKSPWEETFDANQITPYCIQAVVENPYFVMDRNIKMTEDCLFLNLWVPEGGSDLKPVIVFIHGGGFMVGSSNMNLYDGATMSERGDVIVATINYRLGTLGLFSGFIDEAPGNMGMYDQVLAIQWIKDNAKNFGGDPDNIVLMGNSAGSFAVSLHLVSPLSKNLFRRAILESGTAFHPMFSDKNEVLSMGCQSIASMLGCADDSESLKKNPKGVIDCMKSLPVEKISETDLIYFQTNGMLLPRVGEYFLPKNPIDLYRTGNFKKSEVLIGVTSNEGPFLLTVLQHRTFGVYGEKVDARTFNETLAKEVLNNVLRMGDEKQSSELGSYLKRVKDLSRYTYLDATGEIVGDFLITCGALFMAEYQSLRDIPVYFYVFDYRPPSTNLAEWMGVSHAEEIQYVFGNPMYKDFTEFEEEFSKDIMDMWLAFVKTGNPNIPGAVKWPRHTFEDPKYYTISKKDGVKVRPDNYRCEAWRNFFRSPVDDEIMKNTAD